MKVDFILNRVKRVFDGDCSGHDYWHSFRVYKNAIKISQIETCDKTVVAIAALLHDVDDIKLFDTNNYSNARNIMDEADIDIAVQERVIDIIKEISFRGSESVIPSTIEGKIVQDADRLDAMGAIGIARTFAFGGNKNRCIYDPDILPETNMNAEKYINNEGSSINHFYEKLFYLKNMMNTKMAKEIAESRDKYMRDYLEEFLKEWNE